MTRRGAAARKDDTHDTNVEERTEPDVNAVPMHALAVVSLPVGLLVPNPWNPNRMNARTLAKVRGYLQREGFVKPLVVRRHPDQIGDYQILDGEHRWRIAKDLRIPALPCVVVDVDDHRAKVLTVNLNELGGEAAPEALAQLVHDLAKDTSLQDLETELPLSLRELEDHLALLKVPGGLALELDEQAAAHEEAAPKVLTFVVDDATAIEEAIGRLAGGLDGRNTRGRALQALALAWLQAQDGHDAESTAEAS